jgi:hypothetical protein
MGSKKADLMFLQHMVAVLRDGGMLATVIPHGVLFRGGGERATRAAMIEADLLEAVIGLPANLAGLRRCTRRCSISWSPVGSTRASALRFPSTTPLAR